MAEGRHDQRSGGRAGGGGGYGGPPPAWGGYGGPPPAWEGGYGGMWGGGYGGYYGGGYGGGYGGHHGARVLGNDNEANTGNNEIRVGSSALPPNSGAVIGNGNRAGGSNIISVGEPLPRTYPTAPGRVDINVGYRYDGWNY